MFFNYGGVNRNVIYGLLIVLAVISLASMGVGGWISLLLTLPAVIVAITFHEFAHAWTADKLGDTTPRAQGRLNLNPVSHLDFFGFIGSSPKGDTNPSSGVAASRSMSTGGYKISESLFHHRFTRACTA